MSNYFYKYNVAPKGKRRGTVRFFKALSDCTQFAELHEGSRLMHRNQVEGGSESLTCTLDSLDSATLGTFTDRVQHGSRPSERTIDVYAEAYSYGSQDNGKLVGVISCFKFADIDQILATRGLSDVISNS